MAVLKYYKIGNNGIELNIYFFPCWIWSWKFSHSRDNLPYKTVCKLDNGHITNNIMKQIWLSEAVDVQDSHVAFFGLWIYSIPCTQVCWLIFVLNLNVIPKWGTFKVEFHLIENLRGRKLLWFQISQCLLFAHFHLINKGPITRKGNRFSSPIEINRMSINHN